MHILYIYAEITIKGGTDKVLVEKANWLVNHGYEVTMVTESQMGRPFSFELDEKVHHIDMGLDFNRQYLENSLKRLITYNTLMKLYKKQLRQTLFDVRPDIAITAMGRSLSLLPFIYDGSIKIGEAHTTKLHLRGLHLLENRGGLFWIVAKYMRWKMCRSASRLKCLVSLTQNDADDWKNITNTYVIPNPISFYSEKSASLENKQVIMVGRYNDAKGYDYLIPAWEIVHQVYPDWVLNVYGSGELHDDICIWIKERNLDETIILHDPIDNIMDKYLESSICVLTSRYEGFSLVILESMACGVPVVSFDSPYGPRNIIRDGEDGVLVNYLDIQGMADNLCKLIANKELRKRMGANARENVLRFSKDSVMNNWVQLFSKLLVS